VTWREAFAELQLVMEEKVGRIQREEIERINAGQDGAAAALRAAAGE
jgi:hypothetical protein